MTQTTQFHLSLYVDDLSQSVEFYSRLLGAEPSKFYADYAKFDLEDPGLVLSLEAKKDKSNSTLNHMGIKVASKNELISWTSKVAERGLRFQSLENVACCYADQSKIFLNDPSGILFEVYTVNKDLEGSTEPALPRQTDGLGKTFDHVLPNFFPKPLPFSDSSLEKISLRGTLNAELSNQEVYDILSCSQLALKPGGEILLHMLVSDREPSEKIPTLPEPAAFVRRVPAETFIWDSLRESGFVGLQAERLSVQAVFEYKGSQFREFLLKANKPGETRLNPPTCVYLGPFPSVAIETGRRFERGKRENLSAEEFAILRTAVYEAAFVFLNEEAKSCGV